MAPATNEMANPWKIGSNKIIEAPITTAPVVSRIGVVRTAPASIIARFIGTPSFNLISIKSMSSTEFRTITPARAIIPIKDVAVKNAPKSQCPRTIPTKDSGIATIISKSSSKMLESLGHSCTGVNSGRKALDYLDQTACDIVFTDIGMPKMNGWELASAIRKKHGDSIKIIAVTGWNMKEKVEEEKTIDHFLQKPFTIMDLKIILGKIADDLQVV